MASSNPNEMYPVFDVAKMILYSFNYNSLSPACKTNFTNQVNAIIKETADNYPNSKYAQSQITLAFQMFIYDTSFITNWTNFAETILKLGPYYNDYMNGTNKDGINITNDISAVRNSYGNAQIIAFAKLQMDVRTALGPIDSSNQVAINNAYNTLKNASDDDSVQKAFATFNLLLNMAPITLTNYTTNPVTTEVISIYTTDALLQLIDACSAVQNASGDDLTTKIATFNTLLASTRICQNPQALPDDYPTFDIAKMILYSFNYDSLNPDCKTVFKATISTISRNIDSPNLSSQVQTAFSYLDSTDFITGFGQFASMILQLTRNYQDAIPMILQDVNALKNSSGNAQIIAFAKLQMDVKETLGVMEGETQAYIQGLYNTLQKATAGDEFAKAFAEFKYYLNIAPISIVSNYTTNPVTTQTVNVYGEDTSLKLQNAFNDLEEASGLDLTQKIQNFNALLADTTLCIGAVLEPIPGPGPNPPSNPFPDDNPVDTALHIMLLSLIYPFAPPALQRQLFFSTWTLNDSNISAAAAALAQYPIGAQIDASSDFVSDLTLFQSTLASSNAYTPPLPNPENIINEIETAANNSKTAKGLTKGFLFATAQFYLTVLFNLETEDAPVSHLLSTITASNFYLPYAQFIATLLMQIAPYTTPLYSSADKTTIGQKFSALQGKTGAELIAAYNDLYYFLAEKATLNTSTIVIPSSSQAKCNGVADATPSIDPTLPNLLDVIALMAMQYLNASSAAITTLNGFIKAVPDPTIQLTLSTDFSALTKTDLFALAQLIADAITMNPNYAKKDLSQLKTALATIKGASGDAQTIAFAQFELYAKNVMGELQPNAFALLNNLYTSLTNLTNTSLTVQKAIFDFNLTTSCTNYPFYDTTNFLSLQVLINNVADPSRSGTFTSDVTAFYTALSQINLFTLTPPPPVVPYPIAEITKIIIWSFNYNYLSSDCQKTFIPYINQTLSDPWKTQVSNAASKLDPNNFMTTWATFALTVLETKQAYPVIESDVKDVLNETGDAQKIAFAKLQWDVADVLEILYSLQTWPKDKTGDALTKAIAQYEFTLNTDFNHTIPNLYSQDDVAMLTTLLGDVQNASSSAALTNALSFFNPWLAYTSFCEGPAPPTPVYPTTEIRNILIWSLNYNYLSSDCQKAFMAEIQKLSDPWKTAVSNAASKLDPNNFMTTWATFALTVLETKQAYPVIESDVKDVLNETGDAKKIAFAKIQWDVADVLEILYSLRTWPKDKTGDALTKAIAQYEFTLNTDINQTIPNLYSQDDISTLTTLLGDVQNASGPALTKALGYFNSWLAYTSFCQGPPPPLPGPSFPTAEIAKILLWSFNYNYFDTPCQNAFTAEIATLSDPWKTDVTNALKNLDPKNFMPTWATFALTVLELNQKYPNIESDVSAVKSSSGDAQKIAFAKLQQDVASVLGVTSTATVPSGKTGDDLSKALAQFNFALNTAIPNFYSDSDKGILQGLLSEMNAISGSALPSVLTTFYTTLAHTLLCPETLSTDTITKILLWSFNYSFLTGPCKNDLVNFIQTIPDDNLKAIVWDAYAELDPYDDENFMPTWAPFAITLLELNKTYESFIPTIQTDVAAVISASGDAQSIAFAKLQLDIKNALGEISPDTLTTLQDDYNTKVKNQTGDNLAKSLASFDFTLNTTYVNQNLYTKDQVNNLSALLTTINSSPSGVLPVSILNFYTQLAFTSYCQGSPEPSFPDAATLKTILLVSFNYDYFTPDCATKFNQLIGGISDATVKGKVQTAAAKLDPKNFLPTWAQFSYDLMSLNPAYQNYLWSIKGRVDAIKKDSGEQQIIIFSLLQWQIKDLLNEITLAVSSEIDTIWSNLPNVHGDDFEKAVCHIYFLINTNYVSENLYTTDQVTNLNTLLTAVDNASSVDLPKAIQNYSAALAETTICPSSPPTPSFPTAEITKILLWSFSYSCMTPTCQTAFKSEINTLSDPWKTQVNNAAAILDQGDCMPNWADFALTVLKLNPSYTPAQIQTIQTDVTALKSSSGDAQKIFFAALQMDVKNLLGELTSEQLQNLLKNFSDLKTKTGNLLLVALCSFDDYLYTYYVNNNLYTDADRTNIEALLGVVSSDLNSPNLPQAIQNYYTALASTVLCPSSPPPPIFPTQEITKILLWSFNYNYLTSGCIAAFNAAIQNLSDPWKTNVATAASKLDPKNFILTWANFVLTIIKLNPDYAPSVPQIQKDVDDVNSASTGKNQNVAFAALQLDIKNLLGELTSSALETLTKDFENFENTSGDALALLAQFDFDLCTSYVNYNLYSSSDITTLNTLLSDVQKATGSDLPTALAYFYDWLAYVTYCPSPAPPLPPPPTPVFPTEEITKILLWSFNYNYLTSGCLTAFHTEIQTLSDPWKTDVSNAASKLDPKNFMTTWADFVLTVLELNQKYPTIESDVSAVQSSSGDAQKIAFAKLQQDVATILGITSTATLPSGKTGDDLTKAIAQFDFTLNTAIPNFYSADDLKTLNTLLTSVQQATGGNLTSALAYFYDWLAYITLCPSPAPPLPPPGPTPGIPVDQLIEIMIWSFSYNYLTPSCKTAFQSKLNNLPASSDKDALVQAASNLTNVNWPVGLSSFLSLAVSLDKNLSAATISSLQSQAKKVSSSPDPNYDLSILQYMVKDALGEITGSARTHITSIINNYPHSSATDKLRGVAELTYYIDTSFAKYKEASSQDSQAMQAMVAKIENVAIKGQALADEIKTLYTALAASIPLCG